MKLDIELVRKILLNIEERTTRRTVKVEGYSEEQINYHIIVMMEAYLITGEQIHTFGRDTPMISVERATMKGHQLLDISRDSKRWEKVKNIALKLANVPKEVAVQMMIKIAMGQINELMP